MNVISKEFDLRKGHICAFPFNGMTITAQGQVTLCCGAWSEPVGLLKDISDLTDFYNGPEIDYYRKEMEEGRIATLKTCGPCWKRYREGHWTVMSANDFWRDFLTKSFDADWELRKQNKARPIRYLEYSCSNMCNQTCSTCNSFYSSKWRDLEQRFSSEELKKFDRNIRGHESLTDENIQKILKILPNLNLLVVKGGEPWADKNNIKILSEALDTNPECAFFIISNMQAISESTFKMLEKIRANHVKVFWLGASIDGIGRVYDWIRGGSFEKTVRNMERYYAVTGRKIDLIPFTSLHNYFHTERIIEYFMHKEYVSGIYFTNVSLYPTYIRVQNLPSLIYERRKEQLSLVLPKYKEQMESAGKYLDYASLINDIQPNVPFSKKELKSSIEWIEKMNEIRGFRLQDHIKELQEITEMMS
jgi:Radical SAM superfamily